MRTSVKSFFLLSTDLRSFLDLKNVTLELDKRNIPYFFLYSTQTQRRSPAGNLESFQYASNITDTTTVVPYQTLGISLPFKPDVLILTNENWEPEKTILWEFKKTGTLIACIENSSWIHNNIKTKLELKSRKTFPSNCIDVFFDHSNWCKETKVLAGWDGVKSHVVGNPKYDDFDTSNTVEEKIIIVYGSMEVEHHHNLLKIYSEVKNKLSEWVIYYKPHPNEQKEFPNSFKGINLISSHEQYMEVVKGSSYNIGLFTSVMYTPLLLNKNIVYVNQQTSGSDLELDLENFKGHEFDFWSRVLGFKSFEEFASFINSSYIEDTKVRNKVLEQTILQDLLEYNSDMKWLKKKSNSERLKQYYDEYNDHSASSRIVNYLID